MGAVTTTVVYDPSDEAWVASRDGEELGRNHQIDPEDDMAARKWLAWLTGAQVPLEPCEQRALGDLAKISGIGVGTSYALVLGQITGQPGHRTDEYSQWNVNLLYAEACTSLDDDQALQRARTCPSGTSGGWIRSNRWPQSKPCKDQPETHRHLLFEAG